MYIQYLAYRKMGLKYKIQVKFVYISIYRCILVFYINYKSYNINIMSFSIILQFNRYKQHFNNLKIIFFNNKNCTSC